jgi:hypothetical protein
MGMIILGEAIKCTKMEVIEGELGWFAMKRGEGPHEIYNRLKSLVNQVRNYGSKRWTDHEVIRLMLRSFTIFNANLISLVREIHRYTKLSPEEVLGKFVSHQMMVKDTKYINDIANGSLPSTVPQVVAFKATDDKEAFPSKVAQFEATDLNDEEMALVINRFKNTLKRHKDYNNKNKSKGKHACFKCSKSSHIIANCLITMTRNTTRRGRKWRRKNSTRRRVRRPLKMNRIQTIHPPTSTMRDSPPPPSTSPPSFQMNVTLD